ncbi:MAG: hypothetical protein HOV81_07290, partial [Kofleriaceae bacterium]|nr:hypothetical protein [Kofleriaceae bacterium]
MAKRSPILGYNHNVRYRGLVFHVQTEDSGLLNPHLFTHLFHEGVIVSTRKLVYDAGANEEAIKALMQAQHKAVMKDLKKGSFDEKIDQYLGGTPGLEPRAGGQAPAGRGERAPTEQSPPPEEVIAAAQAAMSVSEGSPIEIVNEGLSEPIELPIKDTTQPRTKTAERTSPPGKSPPPPPSPDSLGTAPTYQGSAADVAAAVTAANASAPRTSTAHRVGTAPTALSVTPPAIARTATPMRDSSPVIEINVDDDEDDDQSGRVRVPRDTAVEMEVEALPTMPVQKSRPASHAASALPAMKPPSRPAITPPIITRPATGERRNPDESQPIEIYQPAPPSADPPPGERERGGQYSVKRKDGPAMREQTGRIASQKDAPTVPSGLARPRPGSGPAARDSSQIRAVPVQKEPPGTRPPTGPSQTAQRPPTPGARVPQPPPTPPNRAHATAPIANRTPSPSNPSSNSGVVMTRPAVIVG